MGLLDRIFRRRPPITAKVDVADFIDAQSAFIINRTLYEYARARSGVLSVQLLREKQFQDAVEDGRWKAFPIGVGNVAELVASRLRPHAGDRDQQVVDAIVQCANTVLSRYRVPDGFPPDFWTQARAEVEQRLRLTGLAAPKPAQDIAIASFPALFDLVPLHPDVRKHDFEVVQNNLRSTMLGIAREFEDRASPERLISALL
jgi:hypothetical protein